MKLNAINVEHIEEKTQILVLFHYIFPAIMAAYQPKTQPLWDLWTQSVYYTIALHFIAPIPPIFPQVAHQF